MINQLIDQSGNMHSDQLVFELHAAWSDCLENAWSDRLENYILGGTKT